jgi:hypothetical protein
MPPRRSSNSQRVQCTHCFQYFYHNFINSHISTCSESKTSLATRVYEELAMRRTAPRSSGASGSEPILGSTILRTATSFQNGRSRDEKRIMRMRPILRMGGTIPEGRG